MSQNNARLGILLMIATTFVFALQDGISRHLAGEYNPVMVVMVRYWFFASFVVVYAMRKSGGFRAAVRTTQLPLQIFRGFLLAGEIIVALISFVYLGLVQTHAIFASYPLMVAALAGPVLGEKVGWRRWVAIGVGFVGMLVVLQPGATVFSPYMLVADVCCLWLVDPLCRTQRQCDDQLFLDRRGRLRVYDGDRCLVLGADDRL
jgi:drug/metabolite transporter (DMT)-like permease